MPIVPFLGVSNAAGRCNSTKRRSAPNYIGPTLKDPAGNIIHTEIRIGESVL